MASILLSAAVACFGALFLGQAALRLAGAREWSWLAPTVGLSIAMLVAAASMHVPGHSVTVAVILGALVLGSAVWCLGSASHRPPLSGLLAAVPVAALVSVPFLAAGRGGILGVTVDNDMASHLVFLESFASPAVAAVAPVPLDYPLGPHAVVALFSKGLGLQPDLAFSGWTMAVPVINAWTVQAAVRRAPWIGRAIAATVVGIPFLIAAYYGEGSFKELVLAGLVLALALYLSGCGPRLQRGRWVPVALLIGGTLSVFSLPGLSWMLAVLGLRLAGGLAIQARCRQLREVPRIVRRELPGLGIGFGIFLVSLIPQAHRLWEFATIREGSGIDVTELGNLVSPLPGWEALGIWGNPDFRFPASSSYTGGAWSLFVLALIVFGAVWAFRRGRWLLPLSAAATLVIWEVSRHTQSPYVTAKALVIASPMLMLLAAFPLIDPGRSRSTGRLPAWPWPAMALVGVVLVLRVGNDDLQALRWSPVGPTGHARQLESFRSLTADRSTLVIGNDEFIAWELAGARARPVSLVTTPQVPLRPGKEWAFGQALDFDAVPASTLNEFEWIVSPRDAASSAPPAQLRLLRATEDYVLWKRDGRIPERSILDEGEWPGSVLRCDRPRGREILAAGGVAAVRRPPIVVPAPAIAAGSSASVSIDLPAGTWELEAPYTSPYPVKVTGPGLRAELPANLDRPAARLPIGRVVVRHGGPQTIAFHVEDTALAPASAAAALNLLVATLAGRADRIVPIDEACGRYVDWLRLGRNR